MDSLNPAGIAYVPTTGVRRMHEAPLVLATEESLAGYGHIVHDPKSFPIEITRWPAQGWRPIDKNSGDQGRRDRRHLRSLVERRDALCAQRRGR
jgi:hypothetical protein